MIGTDEFYIGWQTKAPPGIGAHVRKAVMSLVFAVVAAAVVLALVQRAIGVAVFEWGTIKSFNGILKRELYPHLLVQRPGQNGGQSAYYLAAPFKFGLKSDAMAALDGKAVTLTGTLIYRGNRQ